MRRREFVTLIVGVAAAWPLAARAQQGDSVPRIMLIGNGNENDSVRWKPRLSAFIQALSDLGWSDGRNVRIVFVGPAVTPI